MGECRKRRSVPVAVCERSGRCDFITVFVFITVVVSERAWADHYQVFLSHASRDKPFDRKTAKRLGSDGISFFLDEMHLIPGTPWQVALERARPAWLGKIFVSLLS
jgi:hypothetical protein